MPTFHEPWFIVVFVVVFIYVSSILFLGMRSLVGALVVHKVREKIRHWVKQSTTSVEDKVWNVRVETRFK